MKLQEKQQLEAKIKELQEQVDNAVIENDNPFDVKDGEVCKVYYDLYRTNSAILKEDGWYDEYITAYVPCKDASIVEARQKRHHLSDLLEKFAYDNDVVVTKDMWKDANIKKYYIIYGQISCCYYVISNTINQAINTIYFTSEEVAERAITEVVEPFMRGE